MASILLAALPMGSAAALITLTPTSQAQGSSVTVAGTGFTASQAVAILMGPEITVTNESHPITNTTGTGPFTAYTNHGSIKPGSFYYHCVVSSDTNVVESDYYDNGDGTLRSSSEYALNPFVNYVTGAFGRSTTSAWDTYTVVFTCSYTYYQFNGTRTTASSAGAFSANVTVPASANNGTLVVTAFDTKGAKNVSTLDVVPEGFSLGMVIALSVAAVIVSLRFLRKQPKKTMLTTNKLSLFSFSLHVRSKETTAYFWVGVKEIRGILAYFKSFLGFLACFLNNNPLNQTLHT